MVLSVNIECKLLCHQIVLGHLPNAGEHRAARTALTNAREKETYYILAFFQGGAILIWHLNCRFFTYLCIFLLVLGNSRNSFVICAGVTTMYTPMVC